MIFLAFVTISLSLLMLLVVVVDVSSNLANFNSLSLVCKSTPNVKSSIQDWQQFFALAQVKQMTVFFRFAVPFRFDLSEFHLKTVNGSVQSLHSAPFRRRFISTYGLEPRQESQTAGVESSL